MIDLAGLIVVAFFIAFGLWWFLAVWLAIGFFSVWESKSRGFIADVAFLFSAPLYWIVERRQ